MILVLEVVYLGLLIKVIISIVGTVEVGNMLVENLDTLLSIILDTQLVSKEEELSTSGLLNQHHLNLNYGNLDQLHLVQLNKHGRELEVVYMILVFHPEKVQSGVSTAVIISIVGTVKVGNILVENLEELL